MMKGPPMHWPYRWHWSIPRWSSRAMWSASVGMPAVLGGDGGMGLATGVALIHRDHPEVRGELGGGIHGRGGTIPDVDDRLQARGREREDREPLAELLVIDGSVVVCKAGHVVSFLLMMAVYAAAYDGRVPEAAPNGAPRPVYHSTSAAERRSHDVPQGTVRVHRQRLTA